MMRPSILPLPVLMLPMNQDVDVMQDEHNKTTIERRMQCTVVNKWCWIYIVVLEAVLGG
jgi:hypothetical protein